MFMRGFFTVPCLRLSVEPVSGSQIFYSSYLSTYIERDVRDLSEAIDALKFLRFMTATGGKMWSDAEYIGDCQRRGYQPDQAKDWLGFWRHWESFFICALIPITC